MNQYEALLRQGPNEAASGSTGPAAGTGANLGPAGKTAASAINAAAGLTGYGSPELGLGLGFAGSIASGDPFGKAMTDTAFNAFGAFGGIPGQVANLGYDVATAKDPAKSAVSTTGAVVGGLFGGPIGSIVGGALANAAYGSFKDGGFGDASNTRSNEVARDALESSGYSYGQSSEATGGAVDARGTGGTPTERASQEMSRGSGIGVSDMQGWGGTATETAAQEMSRASGLGSAAYGGYSDNDGGGSVSGSSDSSSSGSGIGGVSGADLGKGGEAW